MLLRFGVSNHLSMRDLQEMSLSASSSLKDAKEGLIECAAAPTRFILPAALFYGANASGKSNAIDALRTMRNMVLRSQTQGNPGGGVPRHPFRLDPTIGEPSRFDIDCVVDGTRYHYGFEASDTAFESEWLYAFPKSHRQTLFERDGHKFRFGRSLKGSNRSIAGLTRPNSLYLSAAAQSGHPELLKIYGFFDSILVTDDIAVSILPALVGLFDEGKQVDQRAIAFLETIGTGVIDYRQKETALSKEARRLNRGVATPLEEEVRELIDFGQRMDGQRGSAGKQVPIELAHRGSGGEPVHFDMERESAGTQRLLFVLSLAFRALDEGTVLCVDELNASLHTRVSEAVLRLFCSPETNRNGAQLLATTHDAELMRSSALRRDQIWFTEKGDNGATRIYPLTDIHTRKGDDIKKGYLQGRYGAVPSGDPVPSFGAPKST